MGVLDTAKPFYRLEIFEPEESSPRFIISPNVFLDTELPSDDEQVSEDIYLTSLNINSGLYGDINICELKIKHNPGNAPAIKLNSKIKVYLGYYYLDSSRGPEFSLVYTGYVSNQNIRLQETILECRSSLHRLASIRKKKVYSTMMTLTDIINKLSVDEGGLELASNGIAQSDIKKQPGFSISDNKSLLEHIKELAHFGCLYVYMDIFDKFHAAAWSPGDLQARSSDEDREWLSARDKTESDSTNVFKHELTFGRDLMACEFEITEAKASAIQVIGLMSFGDDPVHTIEPPVVEFTPSEGADPDLPKKVFKISHITREDAEKIAENLFYAINVNLVGKTKVLGSPQIRLGDGVQIMGDIYEVAPFQGLDFSSPNNSESDLSAKVFQVIRVNHIFNESEGFITRLEFVDARATPEAETGEEEEEEEEAEEGGEEEEEEEEAEEGGEEEEEEEEGEEEEDEREEIEFLKLPGINFNFDSAIVLTRDLGDIKGIIEVVNDTDAKVLIAGHTDRMGTETYNLTLSLLRAKSVLAICTGNRSLFREILDTGKWKIEDYQMILHDFGFYEGPEDGQNRPENRQAIRDFQAYYNRNLGLFSEEEERPEESTTTAFDGAGEEDEPTEIGVDGIIGNQTWDAIFRTMVRVMAARIDETKFGDTRIIGCGEYRPIERPTEDQVRSEINRRVEFLLYPEESFPEIRGQPASREAMEAAYNDDAFRFEELAFEPGDVALPLEEERAARTVQIIEIEDTLYHLDSAVLLPEQPAGPSSEDGAGPSEETEQITGITVISTIYNFMEDNPEKQLIIAGHTDTSGRERYNFELSSYRALSVLYLLEGNRDGWAENSNIKNKTEDIQQILKHYWRLWGWDCDPGNIDNRYGDNTRGAVRRFQETYNTEFDQNIGVDGVVGLETWKAFYDCYILELADLQDTTPDGLAERRELVNFVSENYKIVACGESHPIEAAHRDGYRSQVNRRVEVLFFDPDEAPAINCPNPAGPYNTTVCDMATCPLYRPGEYEPEFIDPETTGAWGISLEGEVPDHFAPREENIDISYEVRDPRGRYSAGRIEINGTNYPNNPVAIIPLENITPGSEHTITWDGHCTCEEGPLANGRFINPIYSPYRIVGAVSTAADFSTGIVRSREDRQVKVLVHSLELQLGTYTADGNPPDRASDENRWVQYKLNELGYNSGPVDGTMNDQTRRAIKRYSRALPNVAETETLNDDIRSALENDRGRRVVLEDNSLPNSTEEKKTFVDYNYYYENWTTEFPDPHGHVTKARNNLDRIEFPVEARILLLRRDSETEGVFAPYGVGPLRINWSTIDPAEDISNLEDGSNADVPSRTQPFLELALALENGRTGPDNGDDNCHDTYAGFRRAANQAHRQYFRDGTHLPPFRTTYDNTNHVAYTNAHDDPNTHDNKLGIAGVLFRSSHIAGDDYKLKAQVSFEGLPNAADLLNDHGADNPDALPSEETGTMRIIRRCRVAVIINWPARSRAIDWAEVGTKYEEGHNELDTTSITTMNINAVFTQAQFRTMCNAANGPPPSGDNYTLHNNGIYGLRLPNQTTLGLNAAQYRVRLQQVSDNFLTNLINNVHLQNLIRDNVRGAHPEGWIIVLINGCPPTNVLADPAHGNNTVVNANYVPGVSSYGLHYGIALIDNPNQASDGDLVAHEMGHCRYLSHHETGMSPSGGTASDNPDDHDINDHNCIMCYPWGIPSRNPPTTASPLTWNHGDATQPCFCGKCNLKIRGWDIRRPNMPAQS